MTRFTFIALLAAILLPLVPATASADEPRSVLLQAALDQRKADLKVQWRELHAARKDLSAYLKDDARTSADGAAHLDALQARVQDVTDRVLQLKEEKTALATALKRARDGQHVATAQIAAAR